MPLALLSVSNKTGLLAFAAQLIDLGYELVSTGGTFKALTEGGLAVQQVSDLTGFPEMLSGRVKTLHPAIHAGILAPRTETDLGVLRDHQISPIDVVVVNLYPFRETVARGAEVPEVIENIDIGGPTLLRAAAKNHAHVLPICDPEDYPEILEAIRQGVTAERRVQLARKAFAHTAAYDAAIVSWFDRDTLLPESIHLALDHAQELRYGENPHQQGARYRERGQQGFWDDLVQHGGMTLSYLNLFDTEAAWQLVNSFEQPAAVIVKHANPCGVALGETLLEAYERAYASDPKSAFGGIVALNGSIDEDLAKHILANAKADVIIAPNYEQGSVELIAKRRKNTRLLQASTPARARLEYRRLDAGFLVQEADKVNLNPRDWRVVTERQPSRAEWSDLELAWLVCAYTKSNAIVLVKDLQAVGVGAGQQSRVDAVELAAQKADQRARGGVCASDAFFPFRDGLEAAVEAGVSAVIQPGGSINDQAVIAAANELGVSMVFTGERHFLH